MSQAPGRSLSLDVLRGLTVALMIVVNTPGSEAHSYAQLVHAAWHGFTLTDLVFPTFLFVVGNALSFTLPRYRGRDASMFWRKTGRRALTILLIGVALNAVGGALLGAPGGLRIPGVLQRIALAFALASVVLYLWQERGALVFSVVALLGYWAVLAYGGDYSLRGNAGLIIDTWLFGEGHLYHGEGVAFDPEGLLGTLPATVNVLAGYWAGRVMVRSPARLPTLLLAGAAMVLLGLCWNPAFPINKKLWTSSYAALTIGLDLLLLAALVVVIEDWQFTRWTRFFEGFGKNALAIYLLSELGVIALLSMKVGGQSAFAWIYHGVFEGVGGQHIGSLLFAFAFMLCCWLVAWWLDRRNIIIKFG
jgi:predicted acyltransferase